MTIGDVRQFVEILKQWPAPSTLVWIVSLTVWAMWAHEVGFARDEEVERLKTDVMSLQVQVKQARVETLEGQLFDAKVSQCRATGDLKQIYAKRVSTLQARYLDLTGRPYSLPDCGEL